MTEPVHIVAKSGQRVRLRCTRCDRRYRDQPDWNIKATPAGVVTDMSCPGCATDAENAEAAVHGDLDVIVIGGDAR